MGQGETDKRRGAGRGQGRRVRGGHAQARASHRDMRARRVERLCMVPQWAGSVGRQRRTRLVGPRCKWAETPSPIAPKKNGATLNLGSLSKSRWPECPFTCNWAAKLDNPISHCY